MDETERKEGRFAALKYRDFRLLWFGQLFSVTGSQMQIVALNWHIYVLTKSPIALGMIGLARVIPIIIFSLIGGGFADAHNRKKIQFVTQSLLAVYSVLLAITTLNNTATPMHIYVLTALAAATMSFDMPARQAFVPRLVDRKHLTNAMSLNSIMQQSATIIGPGVAGFAIAEFGVGSIYAFNALSFVAVLVALSLIKTHGHPGEQAVKVSFSSIKEGLSFVKSKTIIWSTMLLDFFSTFFASATALLPIFAQDILEVGPQGLGILYAAPAIGAVVAGFIVAHIGQIKRQGVVLLGSVGIYAFATVLFGFSKSFTLSVFALFMVGVGDGISTIIRNTIRQLETPDHIRGRMTSVNMIFFMGGPQLGEFEAGLLAAAVGGPLSVVIGGVGTLIAVGVMGYVIPTLRNYTHHDHKKK